MLRSLALVLVAADEELMGRGELQVTGRVRSDGT
jgi:hypothetical protein